MMSRTSPVAASVTRRCSSRWSRDVERNARVLESGLHSASVNSPLQEMSSQIDARCWSGGILSRTTVPASTSMITRWIIVMMLSPGSGYFHAFSTG